jgi:phosphoribosyl-AMP cyclohydrolase
MNALEEGSSLSLDFLKLRQISEREQDVIPVVLQHADTNEVLYVAYANELALKETLKTRRAVLWSTSRNELWRKGESSGDVLELVDVRVNCEQNSLLYHVRPRGGSCHTRDADGNTRPGCYYRSIDPQTGSLVFD